MRPFLMVSEGGGGAKFSSVVTDRPTDFVLWREGGQAGRGDFDDCQLKMMALKANRARPLLLSEGKRTNALSKNVFHLPAC